MRARQRQLRHGQHDTLDRHDFREAVEVRISMEHRQAAVLGICGSNERILGGARW
jgi:hypothetical protein